ncbi:hypothetical protein QIH87_47575 [Bradyrhizobium elkanii]|uniref:hypothetical protein n=1 Tax=Bradyrhizobium elkanii TaxID=29448 RepID=UPI0027148C46|nr:hypothetical protein [Bradyrhizobium elkanii]WLB09511.1 hypothetical protein QIH87_47575 [Bradyrhizobium elkanii]WLB72542.1 hypothetical protein QIH89_00750 [Bradyrhizobium elkanii]
MPRQDDLSADHISWLVKSRSDNQEVTLKLFLVMKDNAEKLKERLELANTAQSLSAVCFSLWRAVFLSDFDEENYFHDTISDAQSFLGNLILHNMVAYPQDRSTRAWTFNYYVNNARYRLALISEGDQEILPSSFVSARGGGLMPAKDFWTFHHGACVVAVRNLETKLRKISN